VNPACFRMTVSTFLQILITAFAELQSIPAVAGDDRHAVVRAMQSVVSLLPVIATAKTNMNEPEGTAFAIGDGRTYITADHVLGSSTAARMKLADGSVVDAEIRIRDAQTDIAILGSDTALPPLAFAREVAPGDDVCAVGNAFGLGISLTCGIVSAVGRRGIGFNRIEDFIQTDAAINPGMSGAPLLLLDGTVAGLVTSIFTKQSDGDLGVNFAASTRLVNAVLEDAADGRLDRAQAQMLLRPVPAIGATGRPGGEVVRITPGSAAESAGIVAGDIVVMADDIAVLSQADYLTAETLNAHRDIRYRLLRQGKEIEITVPATATTGATK
jgi:serine protease Do